MTVKESSSSAALAQPRILCLHGGGTSAGIFKRQCRNLMRHLGTTFRFVFVDAPFVSKPHPSIIPFFGDQGPFYRWLRWEEDDPFDDNASAKILACCDKAMKQDEGTGPWVGIMGFSQGAKISASLLWAQEKLGAGHGSFKFGVIISGRAPVVRVDPDNKLPQVAYTAHINERSVEFESWAPSNEGEHALSTPTLHVHGLLDPGLEEQRYLVQNYCKDGTTRVIEWNGGHRLPKLPEDTERVVKEMVAMAKQVGVLDDDHEIPIQET